MQDETPFRIVLIAVSVIQTAINVRYLRRARADVTPLRNRQAGIILTAFIIVSYIAYVIAVLAYLIQPSWTEWSQLALPAWARWMAVGPLLLAGALIIRGLHDLGINLTISPSTKHDHELATTGSYGWVRHPLYSGLFVESAGVCLLMANWFVALCAAVFCGMIAFRTHREEDNLIAKFGDEYRRYQEHVGQFVPTITIPETWFVMSRSTPAMLLVLLLSYLALATLLFGVAGRWDLPWFWVTLVILAASHVAMLLIVLRRHPDLAMERIRPGPGEPNWDKVILNLAGLFMFANFVAAALDVGRFHWTDSVPAALKVFGLCGTVLGMALTTWAMAVNTFFSKVVRIQQERDHRVIQSGPYRFVRHPGYVGWLLLWVSFHLALGSWAAVGMSVLMAVLFAVRTNRSVESANHPA